MATIKLLFTSLLLLVLALSSQAQDGWATWEKNYKNQNYQELIDFEQQYAKETEQNAEIAQYYSRLDKYKITAKSTGKFRPIDNEVLMSMKRVFKLFIGKPEELDHVAKNEYLFEINGLQVWMPMQTQLEEPFKKEIINGTETILYCLFLNEHSQEGRLFNTLLVSEFRTD